MIKPKKPIVYYLWELIEQLVVIFPMFFVSYSVDFTFFWNLSPAKMFGVTIVTLIVCLALFFGAVIVFSKIRGRVFYTYTENLKNYDEWLLSKE